MKWWNVFIAATYHINNYFGFFLQYVVVFKTPPYCEADIRKPVDVSLYLMRPSDNAVGEAKAFTYYPENPGALNIIEFGKTLLDAQHINPRTQLSAYDISPQATMHFW